MTKCPICKKRIWFWSDTLFDDETNEIEYHTRCVLWNNRRGVKETMNITHCHTQLKDGTMCKNIPVYASLVMPQCEKCHNNLLKRFDNMPMWKEQLDKQGKGVSD